MLREMLIKRKDNETYIAITRDRQLTEIFWPSTDHRNLVGNIYLGRAESVLPGMQAAFINIGLERNSFLYAADALSPREIAEQDWGCDSERPQERAIGDLVKRDQQLMVQIFKEPSETKGARVTMQPSLPGRYLVLLPRGNYIAVSRRIEAEAERERLRNQVREQLPPHMGAIMRTVAAAARPEQIAADLQYLLTQWQLIQQRAAAAQAPKLLYSDFNLLHKVIRDTGVRDIDRIVVANAEEFALVSAACEEVAPALLKLIKLEESRDLFFDYDIYNQAERALRRKVWLKSGGYIIIDQTEALTAIDVNTGKYVGENNLNATVLKTNLEAVEEIARQLRLRNIGGIVIIDFIDIDEETDKKTLLDALINETKNDRMRVTVLGMTQLGLVELTRKKVGHSLSAVMEKKCNSCGGKGKIPVGFPGKY
ncbi:MAG: Rne/Rng family ribonuclease [Clostridia bacterium]|nr:Rne/Rng family ribonuclease [Clostridia bacterium]